MRHLLIVGVRANARRWLSTFFAIATAVAFVVGTLVFSDTIEHNVAEINGQRNAGVDVAVRSSTEIEAGFAGSTRPRIPGSVLDEVADSPGVDHAAGTVQTPVSIVGRDGRAIGSGGAGVVGAAWIEGGDLSSWSVTSGRAPNGPGEVVLDSASAYAGGYQLGDQVPIDTRLGRQEVELVGLAALDGADPAAAGATAFFSPQQAQEVAGAGDTYDSVIAAGHGTDVSLAAGVADVLHDPALEVVTGQELRAEQDDRLADELGFVDLLLVAFAAIAVLVATLLIANTFSILVARRLRELALLRALGAGSSQLMVAVVGEAVVLGAAASMAGIGMGLAVAIGLVRLFSRFGLPVGGGLSLSWTAAAAGLVLGTVVTSVAAVLPARRAASTPPIAALRQSALPGASGVSRSRVVVGAALTTLALVSLSVAVRGADDVAFWFVMVGAFAALIAVHTLAPLAARPAAAFVGSRWGAWPAAAIVAGVSAWTVGGLVTAGRRPGVVALATLVAGVLVVVVVRAAIEVSSPSGRIGRSNAMRNPSRTAATSTTLMVGLAVVMAVSVLAASMQATVGRLVESSVKADFVLMGPGVGGGRGVSPLLADDVAALPDVVAVSGKRAGPARVGGKGVVVTAVDPDTVPVLFDLGDGGRADHLGPGQVAVSQAAAEANGWSVGSTFDLEFAQTGPQASEVVSIYEDGAIGPQSDYLLATATFEANFPADAQLDRQVLVMAAPGAPLEELRRELDEIVTAYPQVEVQDQDDYLASREQIVDRIIRLVYALLALSVVIAAIGIVNTLGLSVLERTREIGLLRAVGMTRRQLGDAVRWESLIVAVLGSVTGVVLGAGLGLALASSLRSQGITAVALPLGTGPVVLVLGMLLGIGAAVLPARRAANLPVLDALADQ